jgi:type VI protein secretion system component VasK
MHVRHTSGEVSAALTFPMLAGIGAGAIATGNHIVLIGAVIGAAAVITRAVVRVWQWTRSRWQKLDDIREHADEVPALRAEVSHLRDAVAELSTQLATVLELLRDRDPNARTRSTDPEVTS